MNPITSPAWMTGINAVIGIVGVLETSGVTNVLPPAWGGYVTIGLAVLNTIAHGLTPPTAGPFVPGPVKS